MPVFRTIVNNYDVRNDGKYIANLHNSLGSKTVGEFFRELPQGLYHMAPHFLRVVSRGGLGGAVIGAGIGAVFGEPVVGASYGLFAGYGIEANYVTVRLGLYKRQLAKR